MDWPNLSKFEGLNPSSEALSHMLTRAHTNINMHIYVKITFFSFSFYVGGGLVIRTSVLVKIGEDIGLGQ